MQGSYPLRSSKYGPAYWARSQRELLNLCLRKLERDSKSGKKRKVGTDEAAGSWALAAFSLRRARLRYGDAFSLKCLLSIKIQNSAEEQSTVGSH